MRRRLLAAVAVLFSAVAAHAQSRGAVDWIFLVDTSKSMRGVGAKNIFPDVQASLDSFVRETSDGDSVTLITFDRDVRLHASVDIRGAARDDLTSIIGNLHAEGNRTYLGGAIDTGLRRAESMRARADRSRVRAVVLFTDGNEDVRGIVDPVPIEASLRRVADTFVFFVSMGEHEHEQKLDDFARQTSRARVLRALSANSIRNVSSEIRTLVQPPPVLSMTPASLDLGEVARGKSIERDVQIGADRPVHVSLRMDQTPGITMQPLELDAPGTARLKFDVAEDAAPGAAALRLHAANLASAITAPATLTVKKPSPLRWLVLLALLAALGAGAFAMYRRQNQLEGELEILQPSVAPDAAFVGLPRLAANELALSAVVPPDALAGSDARLFVRRRDGEKKVWISAQSGSLRINDVETPMSELFDADTIRIGDATLRFNRLGHERPLEEL